MYTKAGKNLRLCSFWAYKCVILHGMTLHPLAFGNALTLQGKIYSKEYTNCEFLRYLLIDR